MKKACVMENQLSLVAEFDDLVRLRKVLTSGIEQDFLQFVLSQEASHKLWADCEKKCAALEDKVKSLELANATLETKLKHARCGLDNEMKRRQKLEEDRNNLVRQIATVRDVLFADKNSSRILEDKLAFLSTDFSVNVNPMSPHKNLSTIDESRGTLSPSDVSYDKTEEDLDVAASLGRPKRPSAPPAEDDDSTPPEKKQRKGKNDVKRHRRSKSAVVTAAEACEESAVGGYLKKYNSDSKTNEVGIDGSRYSNAYATVDTSTRWEGGADLCRTPSWNLASPGLKHYGSVGKSLNRMHFFQKKTVIKSETCNPCGKKVRFGLTVLKCRDCKAVSHPECKDLVPIPCIPSTNTPIGSKLSEGCLTDYAPLDPPYIPALVIHCVNEIEARGLCEVGLYRIPGAEKEVKELRERFYRGKGYPNLSQVVDIHVVCGCLKDFLRTLKEPLVTFRLWNDFVVAAENPDRDAGLTSTFQAISQLPVANRDTIAFLMLHLQRVGESEACKMSLSNLAKVFGPTIIGYSVPVQANQDPMQMISDIKKQQLVLERLLTISSDYWMNFINADDGRKLSYLNTPGPRDIIQEESMLGSTPTGTTTMKTILQKHYLDKMPGKLFDSPI